MIVNTIKLLDFLLNLQGLLLIIRCFAADQNLPQVLIHHLLEMILTKDGNNESRVDLRRVVLCNDIHHLFFH